MSDRDRYSEIIDLLLNFYYVVDAKYADENSLEYIRRKLEVLLEAIEDKLREVRMSKIQE